MASMVGDAQRFFSRRFPAPSRRDIIVRTTRQLVPLRMSSTRWCILKYAPPVCLRNSNVKPATAPPLSHQPTRLDVDARLSLLHSEDRDKAFELLEAYIERETAAGTGEDYDRVRGLVPHMRKRYWNAPSTEQVA